MCQEVILQWSKRVVDLEGMSLTLVSIGKPEKAKELIKHLGFENGEQYLFVDSENKIYDALELRRGVGRTFLKATTPFAFLDRILKPGGLETLSEVLSKWNKGTYCTAVGRHCTLIIFVSCLYPTKARASVSAGWNLCL